MKKTILVVLMMAMIATPCLAQEVVTGSNSIFEGTRWSYCWREVRFTFTPSETPPSSLKFYNDCSQYTYGYYEGNVYLCRDEEGVDCFYCNSCEYIKIIDIDYSWELPIFFLFLLDEWSFNMKLGITLPRFEFGYSTYFSIGHRLDSGFPGLRPEKYWCNYGMNRWFKVDDNWIPPEDEPTTE